MSELTQMYIFFCIGDALFFHCNLLHKSAVNNSPNRRWAFLIAYNRASNNPTVKHHHPRYVKLEKVPRKGVVVRVWGCLWSFLRCLYDVQVHECVNVLMMYRMRIPTKCYFVFGTLVELWSLCRCQITTYKSVARPLTFETKGLYCKPVTQAVFSWKIII